MVNPNHVKSQISHIFHVFSHDYGTFHGIFPLLLVLLPSKTHRIHQASDGVCCDVAFYGEVLGAMAWKEGIQRWLGRKCENFPMGISP